MKLSNKPDLGSSSYPSGFRSDIDGLRAIAILLVVAFHAGIPGFAGGFIGVDVFFVISGFLITRNLLREIEATGRIDLLTFWAKRIRRLLPALALTVLSTLLLAFLIQSPIEWANTIKQGSASILYVSNMYFAYSMGYFDEGVTTSPFLHTWSLSVEEQFYVFWPVFFLLILVFSRKTNRSPRNTLIIGLSFVTLVSLGLCIWLSGRIAGSGTTLAFYSLPTRAWEFSLAGLLAAVSLSPRWQTKKIRYLCTALGFGLLISACVILQEEKPYPGLWALLPVSSTLLLIIGNSVSDTSFLPYRALSASVMQWIGRISYSWYLWHWPLIVFAIAIGGNKASIRILAALISLLLAAITFRRVENPLRFSSFLVNSLKRTYMLGGATTVLVLVAAGGFFLYEKKIVIESPYRELASLKKNRIRRCPVNQKTDGGIDYCLRGDIEGNRTVVLVGDSHALQWVASFDEVAKSLGIKLIVRQRSLCPAIPVQTMFSGLENLLCTEYRDQTARLISEVNPDAVIISQFRGYLGKIIEANAIVPDTNAQVSLWKNAFHQYLVELRQKRIHIGVVLDNPHLPEDPILCLARTKNSGSCTYPLDLDRTRLIQSAEKNVLTQFYDIPTLEVTSSICSDGVCAVYKDDLYTMFDTNHLTEQFTLTQTSNIRSFFTNILQDTPMSKTVVHRVKLEEGNSSKKTDA
jgi:peptidoglycan/LPS O-acetylase OafA/YrhL